MTDRSTIPRTPPATYPTPAPGGGLVARTRVATRLALLRARFRLLDTVAPAASVRSAMDLWCTLPAGRRRDHRLHPGALVRIPVPRGGGVVAEHWGAGPVVYLVHGWGGWRGQLGAFVEPLVAAGHRVVAFDAPGHGDSDDGVMGPGRSTVMEMIEAFEVVAGAFGPAAGVVAHSMGSTSAAVVVRESLPTGRLVLVAPNHDFTAYTRGFAALLGLSERTRRGLVDAIENFCHRPLDDFDLATLGADGSMPETLVIHDRHDKETPHTVGLAVAEAWPTATAVVTDRLGHQRILADPAVVELAVGHLTS